MGLTAVICIVAATVSADDTGKDQKALQGNWALVELQSGEGPLPDERVNKVRFSITDDKLVMTGLDGKREFAFKLDLSKKPKAIDLTPLDGPFKGKTTPAIYALDGDTLKLCMSNKTTNDRPVEFKSTKGSELMVFVLMRSKK